MSTNHGCTVMIFTSDLKWTRLAMTYRCPSHVIVYFNTTGSRDQAAFGNRVQRTTNKPPSFRLLLHKPKSADRDSLALRCMKPHAILLDRPTYPGSDG